VTVRVFVLALSVAASAIGADIEMTQSPATATTSSRVVSLPDFWGSNAIWGASGADSRGRIWLGITSNDDGSGSAHLYRLDPTSGEVVDTGDVVSALKRAGRYRPGEKQMKIHSRIVQMPDGYLYFASMDETGEQADGSTLPTWGGHLWRIGSSGRWEHLAVAKQALIAVAGGGPYVYALGYFDHVVYQYDTRTGAVMAKTVGAAGGHVSRNFFADERGHVFVPRVARSGSSAVQASLVELDAKLREVGSTPLLEYLERGLDDSHGIVAVHEDGGGGWFFATGKGRLYHVTRQASGPAVVTDKGWYHPAGPRYVASMFRTADGVLYGVGLESNHGGRQVEWVTRPPEGRGRAVTLPYGSDRTFPHQALLYGSITRDVTGRFYVVGTMNHKPVVLQVSVP
jgi:hypothetical protein